MFALSILKWLSDEGMSDDYLINIRNSNSVKLNIWECTPQFNRYCNELQSKISINVLFRTQTEIYGLHKGHNKQPHSRFL